LLENIRKALKVYRRLALWLILPGLQRRRKKFDKACTRRRRQTWRRWTCDLPSKL